MKTNLQKLIGTVVLGLALVSTSLPAWAGLVIQPEVYVQVGFASGSTVAARYSTDSKQYIGCKLSNNGTFVMCLATDKTGKSAVCTSTDPRFATVIKALTDFSYINFESAQGTGSCLELNVVNESYLISND